MKLKNLALAAILAAALPVLTACPEVEPVEPDPINPNDTLSFVDVRYGTANCILAYDKTEVEFDVTPYAVNPYTHVTIDSWKGAFHADKVADAKVWWSEQTLNLGTAVLEGNKVKVSNISGYGNGGVAIFNEAGEIIWSYHIWKPEIDPTATLHKYRATGNEVMLINLGATQLIDSVGKKNIPATAGCYYQWGRKDPLGRPTMVNARGQATSAMTAVKSIAGGKVWASTSDNFLGDTICNHLFFVDDTTDQKNVCVKYSIQHPTTFITCRTPGKLSNWSCMNPDFEDDFLWSAMKTCYDPCPEGYQVGSAQVWQGFCNGSSSEDIEDINALNKYDLQTLHGYFFCYSGAVELDKIAFYPACGYRSSATSKFNYVAKKGYYYSYSYTTAINSGYGRSLVFGDKDNKISNYVIGYRYGEYRGNGYQIRCIKQMVGQVEPEAPMAD